MAGLDHKVCFLPRWATKCHIHLLNVETIEAVAVVGEEELGGSLTEEGARVVDLTRETLILIWNEVVGQELEPVKAGKWVESGQANGTIGNLVKINLLDTQAGEGLKLPEVRFLGKI